MSTPVITSKKSDMDGFNKLLTENSEFENLSREFLVDQDRGSTRSVSESMAMHVFHHSFSGRMLGLSYDFVEALLKVKIACARANFEAKALNQEKAQEIERICWSLIQKPQPDVFLADLYQGGGGIAINFNINKAISSVSEYIDPRDCNMSQSTADVVATAQRLQLLERWEQLEKVLLKLQITLMSKSQEFSCDQVMGRTCLREALPTTLGHRFRSFANVVDRGIIQLKREFLSLYQVRLGGTVLGGGEGADPVYRNSVVEKLVEVSGRPFKLGPDLYDDSQNIDDLGRMGHALALLSQVLIKICQDLRLMNSGPEAGFNEIELPMVVKGSSFFKNKNNPTVIETSIQACFRALGSMKVVDLCLEQGELDLNTFETQAAAQIAETLLELTQALGHLEQSAVREMKVVKKQKGNEK